MSQRQVCKYYNSPSGCTRANCSFQHVRENQRMGGGGVRSFEDVPRGVCSFYWRTGKCKRGFDCRFKHESRLRVHDSSILTAAEGPTSTSASAQNAQSAMDRVAPYLTNSGLAKIHGFKTDILFADVDAKNLGPNRTHYYLRAFLADHFRFNTTTQMYRFLSLLNSASTENNSWKLEDGQLFLNTIATGNGLLRLGDIIRYPNVSAAAGSKSDVLSFQRGYLSLLAYFSSEYVVKSALNHLVNALYGLLENNFDQFETIMRACMNEFMDTKSFKDKSTTISGDLGMSGCKVMGTLTSVMFEYLTRFKKAVQTHPSIPSFVKFIRDCLYSWRDGISGSPATFEDELVQVPQATRDHIMRYLINNMELVIKVVDREQQIIDRSMRKFESSFNQPLSVERSEALIAALDITYEGPGNLYPNGPRHDNDFVDILDIAIVPTEQELRSTASPYLPANIPNAPHPQPPGSIERCLDIQFRLLREELIAPLRTAVQRVLSDLSAPKRRETQLNKVLQRKGGQYHYQTGHEATIFTVYSGVTFKKVECDLRRGIVVLLELDTPPGSARSPKRNVRTSFWKSGKRFLHGSLAAAIWSRGEESVVSLCTIVSSPDELSESSKKDATRIELKVRFFDAKFELELFDGLGSGRSTNGALFLESPVMFESIRPFLSALKRQPVSFPFQNYLTSSYLSADIQIPLYARVPGFRYNLDCLLVGEEELQLLADDVDSINSARAILSQNSTLDSSQANAMIDTLTRELSLIQGPPGTGKSYTGVELIRVLLANKLGPILMIAFTNHALDHLLSAVLDAKITNKIARLGSRSIDARVSKYSIEELEKIVPKSGLHNAMAKDFNELKDTTSKLQNILSRITSEQVPSQEVAQHIDMLYPDHYHHLELPPNWITSLHQLNVEDEDMNGSYIGVGPKGKLETSDTTIFAFWKSGKDIQFLEQEIAASKYRKEVSVGANVANRFAVLDLNESDSITEDVTRREGSADASQDDDFSENDVGEEIETMWTLLDDDESEASISSSENESAPTSILEVDHELPSPEITLEACDIKDSHAFFSALGCDEVPRIPSTRRPLNILLESFDVWQYSLLERQIIADYWTQEAKTSGYELHMKEYLDYKMKHDACRQRQEDHRNEVRLQILKGVDIIGCTTTGAAKVTALLKGLSPRIMLVEEAGQVLEAHILANLVDSVEHLVLIGDPLQLRPTLNNYALSMDHPTGGRMYRLDMSLMERLASSGLPMSRLDTQRRMRPCISSLIRNTLYPSLEDHDKVKDYPRVKGIEKDLFFLHHSNPEQGGGEDSVSKHNIYEVRMVRDLVLYLLRQGFYQQENSIVILCAYLGQLAKIRDALASDVVVVVDERDEAKLDAIQDEKSEILDDLQMKRVAVTKQVKIRTIDNFQGEEADVVILSLVRNSGCSYLGNESEIQAVHTVTRPNIGFLKSRNRANVALSRAKHGLYILGNANDLSKLSDRNQMWPKVVEQLEAEGYLGTAIPIQCKRHPERIAYISKPGELSLQAPDGGCLYPCEARLECGHVCPYKCHPDDDEHKSIKCAQKCQRLCDRGHPCAKSCGEKCGKCLYTCERVQLPCSHYAEKLQCWQLHDLAEIFCSQPVVRNLPGCEHEAELRCSDDPSCHRCIAICGGIMPCCGRSCRSECHKCRNLNVDNEEMLEEDGGLVTRLVHIQHLCTRPLFCQHPCNGICSTDHACSRRCVMPCKQNCVHGSCKSLCSQPCSPCKEECAWRCPHFACLAPCGSVCARLPCDIRCERDLKCGHRCPSVCGENCELQLCPICASEDHRSSIVDLVLQRNLSEITPEIGTLDELLITLECGHCFTVETLDGHCGIQEYYSRNDDGQWKDLINPKPGFKLSPTCPTCRTSINSPRYGRVYKRAKLDLLETNVAMTMGRSIAGLRDALNKFNSEELQKHLQSVIRNLTYKSHIAEHNLGKIIKATQKHKSKHLRSSRAEPTEWSMISPDNKEFHTIPHMEAEIWQKEIQPLRKIYQKANEVSQTRSRHLDAWQAAITSLYRNEMDLIARDPIHAPLNPEEHAIRMARMKVGQPPPYADQRFRVEAFWVSLDVRFMIVDIAQCWLKREESTEVIQPKGFGLHWANFIAFVIDTCVSDSNIALGTAKATDSRRQYAQTAVYIQRSVFERFKFNVNMSQREPLTEEYRMDLADRAAKLKLDGEKMLQDTKSYYFSSSMAEVTTGGEDFFAVHVVQPSEAILQEWDALINSLRLETFYRPVSLQEKMQVVQAMGFTYSGHFYNCPNGHIFVIGECGGAMETSRCPECGEVIGGSSHNLVSTNTRSEEMEDLARGLGNTTNPEPWPHY